MIATSAGLIATKKSIRYIIGIRYRTAIRTLHPDCIYLEIYRTELEALYQPKSCQLVHDKLYNKSATKIEVKDFEPNGKGKGRPYSITERRVPELIPVLGSQPAGDVNHKPGGRLPLLPASMHLPPQPLTWPLPILPLGEQMHNGCEQFA